MELFDGTVASTAYLGRRVVGTEDCGWGTTRVVASAGNIFRALGFAIMAAEAEMAEAADGLLDGVNDAGLAVSLTFGGRPQVGEGFGVRGHDVLPAHPSEMMTGRPG